MEQATTEDFSFFLERYQQFRNVGSLIEKSFQDSFLRLKTDYERFVKDVGSRELTEALGFNIFYLLGMTRDEVRTHSRFLAELLKPSGSHGQGNLFLMKFIEYCKSKFESFPIIQYDKELEHWNARTEETVQVGRVDILVTNPMLGTLIVIENKVDAYEQNNQLRRYRHWMEIHTKDYPTQALIFLTIRGHQPSTIIDSEVYLLSHKNDIVCWLEDTLPEIHAPVVRETVLQYLDVVKRL